jgi:hypothetical protein
VSIATELQESIREIWEQVRDTLTTLDQTLANLSNEIVDNVIELSESARTQLG